MQRVLHCNRCTLARAKGSRGAASPHQQATRGGSSSSSSSRLIRGARDQREAKSEKRKATSFELRSASTKLGAAQSAAKSTHARAQAAPKLTTTRQPQSATPTTGQARSSARSKAPTSTSNDAAKLEASSKPKRQILSFSIFLYLFPSFLPSATQASPPTRARAQSIACN